MSNSEIYNIEDTRANLLANLKNTQRGVVSDSHSYEDHNWVYKHSGSVYMSAVSKKYDGSSWTVSDAEFANIRVTGLMDSYLSSAIPISQSSNSGLIGFTAFSLVGALNELKEDVDGLLTNVSNWNTAYTHSQIVTGNPHVISYTDLTGVPSDDIVAGNYINWSGNTLNVEDHWYDSFSDLPIATPTDGDTTHVSSADQIYDFVSSNVLWKEVGGYITQKDSSQNVHLLDRFSVKINEASAWASYLENNSATGRGLLIIGGSITEQALSVNNYAGSTRFEVLGGGNANLPNGSLSIGYSNGGNKLGIQTTTSEMSGLEVRKSAGTVAYIGDGVSATRRGLIRLVGGSTDTIQLDALGTSYFKGGDILIERSSTGSVSQTIKNTNTSIGNYSYLSLVTSNNTNGCRFGKYSATHALYPDGAFFWNYQNGAIRFGTNNIEREVISKDGYHGFGVTNPAVLIHASISHVSYAAASINNTNATGSGMYLRGGGTTQYALRVDNYAGTKRFEVLGNGKIYMPSLTHVVDPGSDYKPVYKSTSTGETVTVEFT